jgi:hypothetical protein
MGWLNAPVRLVRNLPIGFKLAMTVVGALSLLSGVSLFALDRLNFVTAMQDNVAAQSTVEHQVQRSLLAAQELRVVSRELQVQQTVGGIRAALERATKQTDLATSLMHEVKARRQEGRRPAHRNADGPAETRVPDTANVRNRADHANDGALPRRSDGRRCRFGSRRRGGAGNPGGPA